MRKYTLLVTLLLAAFAAYSQDIYLQYDPACMDKLEYRFVESTNGASNIPFTTYRVNYGSQEKVFLEAGLESVIVKKTIPGKLSKCSTKLSKSDIADINTGKRKAFVCKKLDSGWALIPTSSGAYMNFNNNVMTYKNANFDLQSELKEGQGGDNLASQTMGNDPKASVFYLGDMTACDSKGYIFKMSPCEVCKIDAEVTFLPAVGVIREQETNGQLYELTSINGMPVCDYIKGAKAPVKPTIVEPKPEPIVIKEEPVVDCGLVAEEGQHVVQRGENVYSIARRYGIAVTSLRSWNNLSTDVIQPCIALKVVAPPKPIEQPSMAVARNNDVPMSYTKAVKPTVVTKTVTKYETKYVTKIVCEAKAKEGEHIVQQGDNLSAVAKLYNVSVSELRSWNKLKNDKLETCSRLKVAEPVVIVKKEVPVSYATVVKPKVKKVVVTPKSVAQVEKRVVAPKVIEKKVVKTEPVLFVKKNSGFHVVQRNETVAGIAKQYRLSETIVRRCNNLDATETLKKGQVLNIQNCACDIPDEPKPKSYNTVVKVKTVPSDVPESYNTVVMPRPVKVKENIRNPDPNGTEGVTSKSVETRVRKYHVVKADDTLESIAKAYSTDEKKLRSLNRLDANERVIPNQLLILE
jgi:LysM repeat protein